MSRVSIAAVKVGISALLIGIIAAKLDFSSVARHWSRLSPGVIAAYLGLIAIQTTAIAGLRLKLLLECVGRSQPLIRTSQVELCGFFFEQVALGFVGGDAMRLWVLHRLGIPLREGFKPLLIDRCFGFAALLLLVAIGLPELLRLVPALALESRAPLIWVVLLGCASLPIVVLFLLPERYRRHPIWLELSALIRLSLRDSHVRARFLFAFLFALGTHLLNVVIFFLIAHGLGLPVTLQQLFFIVPAALLFSMIPISAGGWGLREGVFLLALGALGIAAEEATIVSVLFGLGVLAVTLPGAFVWMSNRRATA